MREEKLVNIVVEKRYKFTMTIPTLVQSLRTLPEEFEKILSEKDKTKKFNWKMSDPFKTITYGIEREEVSEDWYFSVSNVAEKEIVLFDEIINELLQKYNLEFGTKTEK